MSEEPDLRSYEEKKVGTIRSRENMSSGQGG